MQEGRSFIGLTPFEIHQKREDVECTQLNFQGYLQKKVKSMFESIIWPAITFLSEILPGVTSNRRNNSTGRKEKMVVFSKTMPEEAFSISPSTCCCSLECKEP